MELVPKILSWVGYALCVFCVLGFFGVFSHWRSHKNDDMNEEEAKTFISMFQFMAILMVLLAIFGLLMAWHFGSM